MEPLHKDYCLLNISPYYTIPGMSGLSAPGFEESPCVPVNPPVGGGVAGGVLAGVAGGDGGGGSSGG